MDLPSPLHRIALAVFSRLPKPTRQRIIRVIAPTFTVGTQAMLRNDAGQLLLLKTSYNVEWAFPGGLLAKGEQPAQGVVRETLEETGLRIALTSPAVVTLDGPRKHFNFGFHAEILADGPQVPKIHPPEIIDLGWFDLDDLPPLHPETFGTLVEMGFLGPDHLPSQP